jgi:hypothetical protein
MSSPELVIAVPSDRTSCLEQRRMRRDYSNSGQPLHTGDNEVPINVKKRSMKI